MHGDSRELKKSKSKPNYHWEVPLFVEFQLKNENHNVNINYRKR